MSEGSGKKIKVCLVGDGAVGKMCVTHFFLHREFKKEYVPIIFENYLEKRVIEGDEIELDIWLTAGQEDYDTLRPMSYPGTQIFIILFAIDEETSFENVEIKWIKELKEYLVDDCISVLVGNKLDLRNDITRLKQLHEMDKEMIYRDDGEQLAKDLGCATYLECSAKTGNGIDEVFEESVRVYLKGKEGIFITRSEKAYLQTQVRIKFSSWNSKKWRHQRKCMFVGEDRSGKSSLVKALVGMDFKETYHDDTGLEVFSWKTHSPTRNETADEEKYGIPQFEIWDVPGNHNSVKRRKKYDVDVVRKLCYQFCDAVVIVFRVDDPKSLENVRKKWIPEVLENVSGIIGNEQNRLVCRFVPVYLVGTKTDLREEYFMGKREEMERKILNCLREGSCTYTITKDIHFKQESFRCVQCNLVGDYGCCKSCIDICHKGHEGVTRFSGARQDDVDFYCDCFNSGCCKLNEKKEQESNILISKKKTNEESEGEEEEEEEKEEDNMNEIEKDWDSRLFPSPIIPEKRFISYEEGKNFAKEMNLFIEIKMTNVSQSSSSEDKDLKKNGSLTSLMYPAYIECSSKSKKGIEILIHRINETLYKGIFQKSPTTPTSPFSSSSFFEHDPIYFKAQKHLRDHIRKKECSILKIVQKIYDYHSQFSRITKTSSKIEKRIISKYRKDISSIREEEKKKKEEMKRSMLIGMRHELKSFKRSLQDIKVLDCPIFKNISLDLNQFLDAYVEFKKVNSSRLDNLRTLYEKKHQRLTNNEFTDIQQGFGDTEYFQIMNTKIIFTTTNTSNTNQNSSFKFEMKGLEIATVQSFVLENMDGKPIYIGECTSTIDTNQELLLIPNGEGYIFRGYGTSLSSFAKRKYKYFGMIFKGQFKNGVRVQKGVEMDLKTGKIIYEGQYNRDGRRDGKGEEYDLKKFECKKGIWSNGMLIEEEKVFEFGMIQFHEIESQLLPKNEIGRGGNASVFEILWKGNKRAAKIVTIPKGNHALSYAVISRTVRNSLSLLASLNHRNVIKLYGMIEGRSKVGYLMEKCVCDINSVILREKLSFKEKIRILLETAEGMKYLHENEIMNRDLKWSNVLMDESRRIVLTDLDTAREDETLWRNNVQNTSSSIGTPVFIAPELMSRKYDKRIDIYSFGIMIFCLCYGLINPYSETAECPGCKSRIQTLNSYAFPTHVRDCGLRPQIDFQKQKSLKEEERWMIDLMRLCWEKQPNKRPSFEEIAFLLRSKLSEMKVDKIIRISVKDSKTPHHEKIILMEKTYQSLFNKIQTRWPNSEIKSICLYDSKGYYSDVIDLKDIEASEFEERIFLEEEPIVIVEFKEMPMEEELVSVEDLWGKLRDERKEKENLENKLEMILEENNNLIFQLEKLKKENEELKKK